METVDEKLIYRLWWEYLKRSDDYREYCLWHRRRREDPSLPIPEKFQGPGGYMESHVFYYIFGIFLDVHADNYRGRPYSFDVWWDRQKGILDALAKAPRTLTINNYGETVQRHLQTAVELLKQNEGREPSFKDLEGFFAKFIKQAVPPKLFLEIDLTVKETGVLIRKINERILQEKQSPRIQHWERFSDKTNWPGSKLKFSELRRFLIVYDLEKKGLKMAQIVQKVGTPSQKANYNDEAIHSAYREDLAKARRIIKNVEEGSFPGFYGIYSA
ncbi:MAG: hypothetical protein V1816_23225 [Pseudomonadota bacterium]